MTTLVFLDTNFFMMPYQDGIDIFEEIRRLMEGPYELVTLSTVKKELEKIKEKGRGKEKISASVGLGLMEAKKVRIIDSKENMFVDKEIIELTAKNPKEYIVCTNDLELKRALRKQGVLLISMRSKDHLDYSQ